MPDNYKTAGFDIKPIKPLSSDGLPLPFISVPPQPSADVSMLIEEEIDGLLKEQQLLKLRLENEQLRQGQMPLTVMFKFDTKTLITFALSAATAIGAIFLKGC